MKLFKKFKEIVSRQYTDRDIGLHKLTRKQLKEIQEIQKICEKSFIPPYLVLKKFPYKKIGYGIFLHPKAKSIEKGQVIASYGGRVSISCQNSNDDEGDYTFDMVNDLLLTKEEQAIFDPNRPYHPRRLYALILNGEKEGSFPRYINHSEKPNVAAQLALLPKKTYQIIYIAKKKIRPKEQLLVNYEGEVGSYWKAVGIKPFFMTPRTFHLDDNCRLIGPD